jgi:hypothetical protein
MDAARDHHEQAQPACDHPERHGAAGVPPDAASLAGGLVLVVIVMAVGHLYGFWAALGTTVALVVACIAAGVWMVVNDYPPEDLED